MECVRRSELPKLHETPLAQVFFDTSKVIVEVDDEYERRFKIQFSPYQAVRSTTSDCFYLPREVEFFHRVVSTVSESPWIEELKSNLTRIDATASFLDESLHYVVPLGDEILEIIAWSSQFSYLSISSHSR